MRWLLWGVLAMTFTVGLWLVLDLDALAGVGLSFLVMVLPASR